MEEFKIVKKFNCFVGDNASNNDSTLIAALNKILGLELTEENRIRCAAHIINLISKAIIYGEGVTEFERRLAEAPAKAQFKLFRKRGIVGRLHNLVNAILVSNKRRELFLDVQREVHEEFYLFTTLNLLSDGGVRWHSTYRMLLRCWELKESIDRFLRRWKLNNNVRDEDNENKAEEEDGFNPLLDKLLPEEWDEVKQLADFLQPLYQMTKSLEGNGEFGSLWQTITNFNFLDTVLREKKLSLRREPESFLKSAVNQGYEKLQSFWVKLILSPFPSTYAIATILAPRLRLSWFKQQWRHYPSYYAKVEKDMKQVFESYVNQLAEEAEAAEEEVEIEPVTRKLPEGSHFESRFEASLEIDPHYLMGGRLKAKRQRALNELENYYASMNDDLRKFKETADKRLNNPLLWWEEVGKKEYPTLYRMALDYLSIPPTSCDCERAFSGARRTVTTDRNLLHGTTIEALQLQKNWIRNGVVKSPLSDLASYVESL